MKFTWDENKNQANKEKHKINFEERNLYLEHKLKNQDDERTDR